MSQITMPASPRTRFMAGYDFRGATAATKAAVQADGMLLACALVVAALSAVCLLMMCLLPNPWIASLVFVAAYSLFWICLSGSKAM